MDVGELVDALQLLRGGGGPGGRHTSRGEADCVEVCGDLPQSLSALGMSAARVVVEESWVGVEEGQGGAVGCRLSALGQAKRWWKRVERLRQPPNADGSRPSINLTSFRAAW
jgi:hypothetical protein